MAVYQKIYDERSGQQICCATCGWKYNGGCRAIQLAKEKAASSISDAVQIYLENNADRSIVEEHAKLDEFLEAVKPLLLSKFKSVQEIEKEDGITNALYDWVLDVGWTGVVKALEGMTDADSIDIEGVPMENNDYEAFCSNWR